MEINVKKIEDLKTPIVLNKINSSFTPKLISSEKKIMFIRMNSVRKV